jgi:hypothetical protein
MTVLTDMGKEHVLTTEGNWLPLPVDDDDLRVARFSCVQDAELTRRILRGRGSWVQVVVEARVSNYQGVTDGSKFEH